uniref:Uncharacterized protein n=1 Tax=Ditylum brightwellii TaxID=49249 RepID=A0A6V2QKS0_9STRA|mmetsp:Transcript_4231/g.5500  ORF Transcript_4231/g.5500 Transcript_4231/m.5500 type:complete len:188 (-) Transcript_4231:258-821(-)
MIDFEKMSFNDETSTSSSFSPSQSEHGKDPKRKSSASRLMDSFKRGSNVFRTRSTSNIEIARSKSEGENDFRRCAENSSSSMDSSIRCGSFKQKDSNVANSKHLSDALVACMEDRDPVQARKATFWLKLIQHQEREAEGKSSTCEKYVKPPREEWHLRGCPASITVEENDDECALRLIKATQTKSTS